MRSLYSYNVLDSPDYIYSKKIETKIGRYEKKKREKQKKDFANQRAAVIAKATVDHKMAGVLKTSPTNKHLTVINLDQGDQVHDMI